MRDESLKKYDVAISFLVQDLALAQSLRDRLAESLEVFFFPHNQEELAGTDGLESMRAPFLEESRVNLVLFRDRWGKTPWTRVEETAIKEGCLNNGWEGLFFYMVENAAPPKWLPSTHVRFNAGDFPLDQAIGAIKSRVKDQGGRFQAMTPTRKAELFREEEAYRRAKSRLSSDGLLEIDGAVDRLFESLSRQCSVSGIKCELGEKRPNTTDYGFFMSGQTVAVNVVWHRRYTNSLDGSALLVIEFDRNLLMPSEMVGRMYMQQPEAAQTTSYQPSLARWREVGWAYSDTEFISSEQLADKLLIKLFDRMNHLAEQEEHSRHQERHSPWG